MLLKAVDKDYRSNFKMAATIEKEKCISCGICIAFCPVQAIALEEVAEIDPLKCTGCGSCIEVCPNEAISLERLKAAS